MRRKILEPPRAMASLHFPTFSLTIGFDRHNVTRSNLPETHPALGGSYREDISYISDPSTAASLHSRLDQSVGGPGPAFLFCGLWNLAGPKL